MIAILNESFSGLEPLTDQEVEEIENIERALAKLSLDNGYGVDYFERD